MRVKAKNCAPVDLTTKDFVASGGEGSIYARAGLAYKIFHDPKDMIPEAKIRELATIQDPNVIKPQDILFDSHGVAVGYTMRYLQAGSTYVLCQLFTKAFRTKNGLDHKKILDLIVQLRQMFESVHTANCLIVDANEMNFLVDTQFNNVFAIDVNCYQTPTFPPTALMESVRDRHTQGFSELTDWFAFGIVTFQMFIGIHPFKGVHPKFQAGDLDSRMKQNVSVLDPAVKVPAVCYPTSVIPKAYLDWYTAMFQHGKRLPPPSQSVVITGAIPLVTVVSTKGVYVTATKLHEYNHDSLDFNIIGWYSIGGHEVALSKTHICVDGRLISSRIRPGRSLWIAGVNSEPTWVNYNLGLVTVQNLVQDENFWADQNQNPKGVMSYDGRGYILDAGKMWELAIHKLSANSTIAAKIPVANVLENSAFVGDGVVIQNLLGATYLSLFPSTTNHLQVRVPRLDHYKIIEARCHNMVCMVIGALKKGGQYDRIVLTVESDGTYTERVVPNITPAGLNFVRPRPSGPVVMINENDEVEISAGSNVRTFKDPTLDGNTTLCSDGQRVLGFRGSELFAFKLNS